MRKIGLAESNETDRIDVDTLLNKPKRCAALRRDGDTFIVVLEPEDIVAFRNADANALRKICTFLGWKIVNHTSDPLDMAAFLRR